MSEGRLIKNKLRIVRQVGRGGMGYVYEVFHEGLRVTRALKQIVGDLQDNPDIERRFLHEAQMMARLEHPHIVRVFDIDNEPGLRHLPPDGVHPRPRPGRSAAARGSLLLPRDAAHRHRGRRRRSSARIAPALVHRDIKPANILIEDGTGRPVVTDFGIAKEVESAGDESFTRTGSFVGTYRYSSREQIRSEKGVPIDGRADIYSLGVVLYEIYAGRKYLAGMPELQDRELRRLSGRLAARSSTIPSRRPSCFDALIDECIAARSRQAHRERRASWYAPRGVPASRRDRRGPRSRGIRPETAPRSPRPHHPDRTLAGRGRSAR